jgi:hypothetical protein
VTKVSTSLAQLAFFNCVTVCPTLVAAVIGIRKTLFSHVTSGLTEAANLCSALCCHVTKITTPVASETATFPVLSLLV